MAIRYLDQTPIIKPKIRYLDEEKPKESIGSMLLNNLKEAGKDTYREAISPILSGISTFAGGIPKMVAKEEASRNKVPEVIFPEQKTFAGKALRGASEVAGFTAGLPARAATFTGRAIGQGVERAIPKFAGKALTKKILQGSGAGSAGMAVSGDTLGDRKNKALIGAVGSGVLSAASPVANKVFNWGGKIGSTVSGIEKEIYEEAQQKGFRNVLKSKFYDKKLPAEIQDRIILNLDNIQSAAGDKYESLTQPLRKTAFDMAQLRGDVIKKANRIKMNPFDTDVSKLDNAILDGIVNKAEVKNLGDALDLRRNLDDVIYNNKGELKSTFGKQVRDILNKSLHQNKDLKKVDEEWSNFLEVLRDSKKIVGDTGEKILARFGSMTDKQKQMLVQIEKEIGGVPFIEDLTNWSLAKNFTTKTVSPSVSGVVRAVSKPVLRGYLRQGEKITGALDKMDKKYVNKLVGK